MNDLIAHWRTRCSPNLVWEDRHLIQSYLQVQWNQTSNVRYQTKRCHCWGWRETDATFQKTTENSKEKAKVQSWWQSSSQQAQAHFWERIHQVIYTNSVTYKLKDYKNQPISGGFYEQDLLKVKRSDVYLGEKEIKKHGNKVFVKWLGFDSSLNSWIHKSDV